MTFTSLCRFDLSNRAPTKSRHLTGRSGALIDSSAKDSLRPGTFAARSDWTTFFFVRKHFALYHFFLPFFLFVQPGRHWVIAIHDLSPGKRDPGEHATWHPFPHTPTSFSP